MSDEVVVPASPELVPDQSVTVTPESAETKPEVVETPESKPPRVFTQEELDAEIGKRLGRAQRKWEREQAAKAAQEPTAPPVKDVPPIEQHESPEAYALALAESLAETKARELIEKRDQTQREASVRDVYLDREEVVREKYDDYDKVARNPKLHITPVMADAIMDSEIGPEVTYHLGMNPDEAFRISRLTTVQQIKEIAKLEVKVSSSPPVKRTTATPTPITPVNSRSSGSPAVDTTDPRSIKSMTTSEWIAAERQRQLRKKMGA